MNIPITGYAEIDQQHELIEFTLEQLANFCSESQHKPNISCGECHASKKKHCKIALDLIFSEVKTCLAGHNAYEEKLMELLPPTPLCQSHIKAHKAAHEWIWNQLMQPSLKVVDDCHMRDVGTLIRRVVGDWLANHSNHFDVSLIKLSHAGLLKKDYDHELAKMLDQHVFPTRPTKSKVASGTSAVLSRSEKEVRERFESLSPAQSQVFWLIVNDKTNREIADELHVSVNTIKTHRASVFLKMDVKTALGLAKKAHFLR